MRENRPSGLMRGGKHPVIGPRVSQSVAHRLLYLWSYFSSVSELAARLRDGAAEFASGFQPLPDDELGVGDGFLIGRAIGHAAGQFGDFDDETFVGSAPVDDEFVAISVDFQLVFENEFPHLLHLVGFGLVANFFRPRRIKRIYRERMDGDRSVFCFDGEAIAFG